MLQHADQSDAFGVAAFVSLGSPEDNPPLPRDPRGRHRPLDRHPLTSARRRVSVPASLLYAVLLPISAALGAALKTSGLL